MQKKITRMLAWMLALVLLLPVVSTAATQDMWGPGTPQPQDGSILEYALQALREQNNFRLKIEMSDKNYGPDEPIYAIVELKENPAVVEATARGIHVADLADGEMIADRLLQEQAAVEYQMEARGVNFETEYHYTALLNGFAVKTTVSELEKIAQSDEVFRVYVSNQYDVPVQSAESRMMHSHKMIDDEAAWAAGYKGEGTVIAILDTGIELDNSNLKLTDASKAKLTEDKVNDIIANKVHKGKYYSAKVPFGYNYYDKIDNPYCAGSDHGLHVSGSAAANGKIKGVAPEAQILAMKVFGNDPYFESTFDHMYVKAMDDAILLGADVINMSLGAPRAFYRPNSATDRAITRCVENGITLAISAGNSGSSLSKGSKETPDYGMLGSPSINKDATSIASVNNQYLSGKYGLRFAGKLLAYNWYSSGGNVPPVTPLVNKEFDLAYVGKGYKWVDEEDPVKGLIAINPEYENVDLKGKIAFIDRGDSTFYEKTLGAQDRGAVAVIIGDNKPGTINMSMSGQLKIPAVSVTQEDRNFMFEAYEKGERKTVFTDEPIAMPNPDGGGFMSGFSSWGATPDFKLKPELTAPGGAIYSMVKKTKDNPEESYEAWNGTSMAAPHVAGGYALLRQYVRDTARLNQLNINAFANYLKNIPNSSFLIGQRAYASALLDGPKADLLLNAFAEAAEMNVPVYFKDQKGDILNFDMSPSDYKPSGIFEYFNADGVMSMVYLEGTYPPETGHELTVGDTTRLIEILMMNAARILVDEKEIPYSPRQQGAGLMQVKAAMDTPVFMVNRMDNEAKVELYDFMEQRFTLPMRAFNTTGQDMTYAVDLTLLKDFINEKGENITAQKELMKFTMNGPKEVVVPANGYVDFDLEVDFSSDNPYLGMIVEGFVQLKDKRDNAPEISIPFMGYYGSWGDAPIIDSFDESQALLKYFGANPLGGRILGWFLDDKGNFGMGIREKGNNFLNPNPNNPFAQIMGTGRFGVVFGLLRNAQFLDLSIEKDGQSLGTFKKMYMVRKGADTDFMPYKISPDQLFEKGFNGEALADGFYDYVIRAKAYYPNAKWQERRVEMVVDGTAPEIKSAIVKDGKFILDASDEGAGLFQAIFMPLDKDGKKLSEKAIAMKDLKNGVNEMDLKELVKDVQEYSVSGILVDKAGNSKEFVAIMGEHQDTDPPLIVVIAPEVTDVINKKEAAASYKVWGVVFDTKMPPVVKVNGYDTMIEPMFDVAIPDPGNPFGYLRRGNCYKFEAIVPFEEGYREINVEATTNAGVSSSIRRFIFVDWTAPEIVKAEYLPEVDADTADITLTFKDKVAGEMTVRINDRDMGTFATWDLLDDLHGSEFTETFTIPLEMGENEILIQITDSFDNTMEQTITINRTK